MGAVQKLATTVIVGLVALATLLVVLLANEGNRRDDELDEQEEVAIERAIDTYIANCVACHGPGGEGLTTPGEQGTGRIGLPLGGMTEAGRRAQELNQSQDPTIRKQRYDAIHDVLHYGRGQMPAWGIEGDNRLNDEQIEELILMIQNVDWDHVYNEAIETYGGYPTPQPPPVAAAAATGQRAAAQEDIGSGQAASPVASPASDAQTGQPQAPPAAAGAPPVTVEAKNIQWVQKELTIPANTPVVFSLVNSDPTGHNFTIDALNFAVDMPASTTTQSPPLTAPPGTYEYVCTVPGHELLMTGKLIVSAEAAAPAPAPDNPPAAEASAPPAAAGAAPAAGAPVTVEAKNIQWVQKELTIPANTPVTFSLVNTDPTVHNFTIEALGYKVDMPASQTVAAPPLTAPPGTYEYVCTVPGHELLMTGQLIVQ